VAASQAAAQGITNCVLDCLLPTLVREAQHQKQWEQAGGGGAGSGGSSSGCGGGTCTGSGRLSRMEVMVNLFDLLDLLSNTLPHDTLRQVLRQRAEQPGSLALLPLAAELAQALPLCCPEGLPAGLFSSGHISAARLACFIIVTCVRDMPDEPSAIGSGAGSAGSGSSADATTGSPTALASVDGIRAGAWQLLAVQDACDQERLSMLCGSIDFALPPLNWLTSGLRLGHSVEQAAVWAAAADASYRLLPCLVSLDQRWRQQGQPCVYTGQGTSLAVNLLLLSSLVGGLPKELPTALQESLCRLHARSCRLAHFLAQPGNPLAAAVGVAKLHALLHNQNILFRGTVRCLSASAKAVVRGQCPGPGEQPVGWFCWLCGICCTCLGACQLDRGQHKVWLPGCFCTCFPRGL